MCDKLLFSLSIYSLIFKGGKSILSRFRFWMLLVVALLGVIALLYRRWRRERVARLNATGEVQMEVSNFYQVKQAERKPSHY